MKLNLKRVKKSVINPQPVNVIPNHIDKIILYILKRISMQVLKLVRKFTVDALSQRHWSAEWHTIVMLTLVVYCK